MLSGIPYRDKIAFVILIAVDKEIVHIVLIMSMVSHPALFPLNTVSIEYDTTVP